MERLHEVGLHIHTCNWRGPQELHEHVMCAYSYPPAGHRKTASAGDVLWPPQTGPAARTSIGRWTLPRSWTRKDSGGGGSAAAAPEASEASSGSGATPSLAGITLASSSRKSLVARTDSR